STGRDTALAPRRPRKWRSPSRAQPRPTSWASYLSSIRPGRHVRERRTFLETASSSVSEQNDGPHRRRLRVDDVERKADERDAVLADAIQILQVRHGEDAVFAQRAGIMKHARRAGFVIAVVEIIPDDHDALVDAPLGAADGQVRGRFHPFVRAAVICVVVIGAQKKAISRPDASAYGALEIVLGDRFARHLVAQVGD